MSKLRSQLSRLRQWWRRKQNITLTSVGVAGCIILLRSTGILQTWEWAAYDQLFRLRPPNPTEDRILIVAIDEEDIQNIGEWPIPDELLAKTIEKLNESKPRAIGLDIYRDLPVQPGRDRLETIVQNTPNFIGIEKLKDEDEDRGINPPPFLPEEAIGFNNIVTDADGRVRRSVFYWHREGELHTSLALRLALLYLQEEGIKPKPSHLDPKYLQLGSATFVPLQPNDGAYVRLDHRGYQILIDFRRPRSFDKVHLRDVLAGEVDPQSIRDRIVLIGSTAASLGDISYIPYSTNPFGSVTPIYGVELHANFISHIFGVVLDDRPTLRVWSDGVEGVWIFCWCLLGAVIVVQLRSPLRCSAMLLLGLGILVGGSYGSFLLGWWIPLVPPLLGFSGAAVILTGYFAYQEEELKRSMEFLQSTIDNIPDPIFVKDRSYRWIILNQAFAEFSGYPLEELLQKTDADIFPLEEAKVFRKQDEWVFRYHKAKEHEEKFTNAFGETFLTATKRSLHKDAAGNIFLVGVIRDITERKKIEEELRRTTEELSRSNAELQRTHDRLQQMAYSDSLTGLANRKGFYESFTTFLAWAKENNRLVGLLYLDLDGFKQVNDSLGHQGGDLLLQAVAERIEHSLRDSDRVARLGGDEFTVLLPGIKQAEDVEIVARKITQMLAEPFILNDQSVFVTVSIGSSVYPRDGESEELLINLADRAMYAVKNGDRPAISPKEENP